MSIRWVCFVLFTVLVVGTAQAGWGTGWRQGGQERPADTLSVEEAGHLRYLREEEKLARDVYDRMYQVWGLPIFDNISSAEQRHMDAALQVISSYGLSDPAYLYAGEFSNGELQALYDSLEAQGRASQLEALLVGGLIEEVDMQDLHEMLAATDNGTLISLYEKLLCGSRNHLRAFVRQIENRGMVYEAQVLSQDKVDAIVDSSMERRCGARRSGRR
ncbi:MAG: DUF2202 domain-containing protein [Candidatus Thiodiazotropha sp. (ex Monitilora ramsayi)]|nr:DUF2202 domain-containing protein [Candidatus Thiodiazotropha sp. (ex Monitilora ramsayi)]